MKFTYSTMAADAKPTDARPYQSPKNYEIKDVDVREMMQLCVDGHAWRAAIYDKGFRSFKKQYALGSNVLALDFDGVDFTPYEVANYAASRGIKPSFYYYSFSQDEAKLIKNVPNFPDSDIYIRNRKKPSTFLDFHYKEGYNFRLVWCLDKTIDVKTYEGITKTFIENTFSKFNPDKSTKDVSRLWYGGRTMGEVLEEEPINVDEILRVYVEDKREEGIRKDKLKKNSAACAFITRNPAPESAVIVPSNWEDYLAARCDIWDKWIHQEYIDYIERRNLWSNLSFIKYKNHDKSILKDVLKYYEPEKWVGHSDIAQEIIQKVKHPEDWNPRAIVKANDGTLSTIPEFFEHLAENANEAFITPDVERVKLEELDEWMDSNLPAILANDEFIYFTSQTGSGKTERVIKYLANDADLDSNKVVYAVPQYITAQEFVDRFNAETPFKQYNVYTLTQNDYSTRGLARMKLGLSSGDKANEERLNVIHKLMDENEKGLFVITHALLANLSNIPADRIIVDENIEEALCPQKTLDINQLSTIKYFITTEYQTEYQNWLDKIANSERGKEIDLEDKVLLFSKVIPSIREHLDDYLDAYEEDSNIATGIFELPEPSTIIRTTKVNKKPGIVFVKRARVIYDAIQSRTPIKLLTATPMNVLLEKMYKVSPKIVSAPHAKNKGSITQYRNTTGARGIANGKVEDMISLAEKTLPAEILDKKPDWISFKGTAEMIEKHGHNSISFNDVELHFGNNRGLDFLKGRTLVVLGKPDKNQDYYYQLWDLIGDGSALDLSSQYVMRNGIKQKLFLFNNEIIKDIQIQNLEYSLAQTVGRARALREAGAEVYIFANYVCEDVDKVAF